MSLLRFLPRFRRAQQALPQMQQRECWSRGQVDEWQLRRLNQVWQEAAEHVPHYRDQAREHDLPATWESLDQFREVMPRLPKPVVRDQPESFLSARAVSGRWQRTGGSTGTPTRIFWPHQAHWESLRGRYRHEAMYDVGMFDRKAFLWGHAGSFAPGWRGRLNRVRQPTEDWLRRRLRLSAYELGEADLQRHLTRLQRWQPSSLYGYSSAIYLLARAARDRGVTIESLRMITLTGEPAFPDMVETIEDAFGVPAVLEYGSVECGIIANEWPDRALHVREDAVLVETDLRDDGYYDVLVSVLTNSHFPLLRYAIGDLCELPLEFPATGFAILPSIAGRNNDMVVTGSGRLIHSLAIKHVLEEYNSVRRFRAYQDASGHIQITIEADLSTGSLPADAARQHLLALLQGFPVTLEIVDQIESNLAGKHRWVQSELVAAHS